MLCCGRLQVAGGYRRPLPSFLPEKLRELIADCWAQDMHARPSMARALERLYDIESQSLLERSSPKKTSLRSLSLKRLSSNSLKMGSLMRESVKIGSLKRDDVKMGSLKEGIVQKESVKEETTNEESHEKESLEKANGNAPAASEVGGPVGSAKNGCCIVM